MSDERVNILLVDDRDEDLFAMKNVLAGGSYEVTVCRSGSQALREVLQQDFAVILLDLFMPVMDGFEVASIIKQRDRSRHTPIIFLTAAGADLTFIYRAYSVGAVDYLTKPIDRDVVRAKIGIFADLFRKDRQIKEQAEALLLAQKRERERELTELRQLGERRYRALAEAIPQILWTASPDGAFDYFNRRWFDYTGLGEQGSRGWAWLDVLHEEEREAHAARWRESVAAKAVFEAEGRLRRADGSYRWHLCRAVPDVDRDGHVSGWHGTFADVDDLKRAHREAEEAIRLRDEFLSIASHELRTPLATLGLQIDGLLRKLGRDANGDLDAQRLVEKINIVRRQADRLNRLVEGLLDVSRISAGRFELTPQEVDLSAFVVDITQRFQDALERSGSQVHLSTPAPVIGAWDPLALDRIVSNLVGNAIKYGRGGDITVSTEQVGERARLRVQDAGIGIAPDHHARIFERFERAVSTQHYGGLGLGLWITRKLAEAMRGQVSVESAVAVGSTFTVELPIK